jgi:hypothetical protein
MTTKTMTNEELTEKINEIKHLFAEKKAFFGSPEATQLFEIENEMQSRGMLKTVYYNED